LAQTPGEKQAYRASQAQVFAKLDRYIGMPGPAARSGKGRGVKSRTRISDTDFAVQGNCGIMIQPWDHTRIGIRYLTETDLDFEDDPRAVASRGSECLEYRLFRPNSWSSVDG